MDNLLTTKQAAEILGLSLRRVQDMVKQSCPACGGEGAKCPRCRGTGHKLPHQELGHSGRGPIRAIYPWALDLPDIRDRWVAGRPIEMPENVEIQREGKGKVYAVIMDSQRLGTVYRKGEARRSWTWETGEASGETYYRNRKDAITALLEHARSQSASSSPNK